MSDLRGSSRTDAGVHAMYNTFHIDFKHSPTFRLIPPENLQKALNKHYIKFKIPINILEIRETTADFHARFSAKSREYIYKIYIGESSVFNIQFFWVIEELNMHKLEEGIAVFDNKIDINDVCKVKNEPYEDPIVKIDAWLDVKDSEIHVHFKSIRFFWHQIRYMVGALIDYSLGKISLKQYNSFFDGTAGKKPNRAPAEGLYLSNVEY